MSDSHPAGETKLGLSITANSGVDGARIMEALNGLVATDGESETEYATLVTQRQAVSGVSLLAAIKQRDAKRLAKQIRSERFRGLGILTVRVVNLDEWFRDTAWIQRIIGRDQDALREVMSHFGGVILHSLRRRYEGVLPADEIESLLNQAAGKLWKSATRFDPYKAALGTWLYKITENLARDVVRGQVDFNVPLDYEPGATPPEGWLSSESVPNKQLIKELNEVVEALPRVQNAVIVADLAAGGRADDAN